MNAKVVSSRGSVLASKASKRGCLQIDGVSVRDYQKPVLVCYGDVRDVTLGGSALIFEGGPYGTDGCKLSGQPTRSCLP